MKLDRNLNIYLALGTLGTARDKRHGLIVASLNPSMRRTSIPVKTEAGNHDIGDNGPKVKANVTML